MRDYIFFDEAIGGGAQGGQLARFRYFGEKNKEKIVYYHFCFLFLLELVLNYMFDGKIYIK